MGTVLLTALAVGGATMLGALLGFFFRRISLRFHDTVLSLAAGIMLGAAILGLIMPSVAYGEELGFLRHPMANRVLALAMTVAGLFLGALTIHLLNRLVPHLHRLIGERGSADASTESVDRILLFVLAIAIHNLPEGLAAGVGFGSGNTAEALLIAGGVALQNVPEGMVIIAPMLAAGIRPRRTLVFALMTGVIEIIGTFLGYGTIRLSSLILPFALAFAGGTMLYVIVDEMIPDTHGHGHDRGATYAFLVGTALMLVSEVLLT